MTKSTEFTDKTMPPHRLAKNIRYPVYQFFAITPIRKESPEIVLAAAIREAMEWLDERFRDFGGLHRLVGVQKLGGLLPPGGLPHIGTAPDSSLLQVGTTSDVGLPPDTGHARSSQAHGGRQGLGLSGLSSFIINEGYRAEVSWLPAHNSWSLQLSEPDVGAAGAREPVPGRLIESNAAFRIFSGRVECGFRVVISEPKKTHSAYGDHLLSLIRRLAENPHVGLVHGLPIQGAPHTADTAATLKKIVRWLRDKKRMMPAIISLEHFKAEAIMAAPNGIVAHALPQAHEIIIPPIADLALKGSAELPEEYLGRMARRASGDNAGGRMPAHMYGGGMAPKVLAGAAPGVAPETMAAPLPGVAPIAMPGIAPIAASSPLPGAVPMAVPGMAPGMAPGAPAVAAAGKRGYLLDLGGIAMDRSGYAQFIHVPFELQDAFQKLSGQSCEYGETIFWPPAELGGIVRRYSADQAKEGARLVVSQLESLVQSYASAKRYSFGNVWFVPEAKQAEQEMLGHINQLALELEQAASEKERALELRLQERLLECDGLIKNADKKVEHLQEEISTLISDKYEAQRRYSLALDEKEQALRLKDAELERLRAMLDRPKEPRDVAAWVGRHFQGKLIFHPKASDLMKKLTAGDTDVPLICDALEFLATDYRNEMLGMISADEMRSLCMQKYNRPFEVTPVRGVAIDKWPGEYKIKYNIGHAGRPIETPLDIHLRVGNDSGNLLRVYFLYDKENKLIVVGSLPKHLSTESY